MSYRIPTLAAVTLSSLAAMCGPALAQVTASTISTPSDLQYILNQGQSTIEVSGTATSSSPSTDSVDIWCTHDDGDGNDRNPWPLLQGVPLSANGHFSTAIGLPTGFAGACRLRAVPYNSLPSTGLSAFAGPRLIVSSVQLDQQSLPGGAHQTYDFQINGAQLGGEMGLASAGDWGISETAPYTSTVLGAGPTSGFEGGAWFMNRSDTQASQLQVDGTNVYTPYSAYDINHQATGLPSIAVNATQDPTNGSLTVTDDEPLVTCPGTTWAGFGGSSCSAFAPAGIELRRTVVLTGNGRIVNVTDSFVSVDGAAHHVEATYSNRQDFDDTSSSDPNRLGYEFPGQSTFSPHAYGDEVGVGSGAPASVLIRDITKAPDDPSSGIGSITWSEAPQQVQFADGYADTFTAKYAFDVAAGGQHTIHQTYATELTAASVNSDDLATDDSMQPPQVSFTAPVPGSAFSSPQITVTGTASAGSGVAGVKVNGVTATLGQGGTFTATVPLKPGTDTLTAVVSSAAGGTATAKENVSYSGGGGSGLHLVLPGQANVHGHVLALTVSCAGSASGRCAGRVSVTYAGKPAGSMSTSVASGARAVLHVTLPASVVAGLRRQAPTARALGLSAQGTGWKVSRTAHVTLSTH